MTQAYFNPERERDPHALPDCEVFYISEKDVGDDTLAAHAAGIKPFWSECGGNGWYWWACSPGHLPDGDASGPFASYSAALVDARSNLDEETP